MKFKEKSTENIEKTIDKGKRKSYNHSVKYNKTTQSVNTEVIMKVTNHTTEIEKALHLDEGSVKHEGNFFFSGKLNGHKVQICTEPANDDQESVNIYSIEIGD